MNSPSFKLPIPDLLLKINPDAVEGVRLMPSHWTLYDRLKKLADQNGLIIGSKAPKTPDIIYDELFSTGILTQAPSTYEEWRKLSSAPTEREAADHDSHPEAKKPEAPAAAAPTPEPAPTPKPEITPKSAPATLPTPTPVPVAVASPASTTPTEDHSVEVDDLETSTFADGASGFVESSTTDFDDDLVSSVSETKDTSTEVDLDFLD